MWFSIKLKAGEYYQAYGYTESEVHFNTSQFIA